MPSGFPVEIAQANSAPINPPTIDVQKEILSVFKNGIQ
jgi:hypothetical protein